MFWLFAALILLLAIGACARSLLHISETPHKPDIDVYKDQLAEVARDAERGILTKDEAERTTLEISRKLLAADAASVTPLKQSGAALPFALCCAGLIGITGAAYFHLGAPGYQDLPLAERIANAEQARANRPRQAAAEQAAQQPPQNVDPQVASLLEQLRSVVANRPNDAQGLALLARNEAAVGNYIAAHKAQSKLIALKGAQASAGDHTQVAELMIIATNGYVSPEAEANIRAALRKDPSLGLARYYMGLTYAQGGRADLAFPIWKRLVGDSAETDPWLPAIYNQIEQLSMDAGDPTSVDALPKPRADTLAGPTAEDVEAMSSLSLSERMEAITNMVERLSDRLAREGGSVQEWARLINSLGVIGRLNGAKGAWDQARVIFAGDQGALDLLAAAADRAGLAPLEMQQ